MAAQEATNMSSKPTFRLSDNNLQGLLSYRPSAETPYTVISHVSLPRGALITPVTTATIAPKARYSTVQIASLPEPAHIELNSALLYMNHSCVPSVEVHVIKDPSAINLNGVRMEVRVAADRDLQEGDELSFFYPSTEWHMARPFECECTASKAGKSADEEGECLGMISGADSIDPKILHTRGWFLNEHIKEMLELQGKR